MDLRWLDDVLVLLEERNLSRAAERRNITQPAFSRRIRAFEDWLGTPIIERQANRIDASPALLHSETEIRALAARLRELPAKVAHSEASRATVTIAAQHAPTQSVFPELALRARKAFPKLSFRLRAGNLDDCVALLLRGDASLFLCYEAETTDRLEFGPNISRSSWGTDFLVPLIGGELRYAVNSDGTIPSDTPAITYPTDSYFGDVLRRSNRAFSTSDFKTNSFCTTAFSSGILEMVTRGLGVAWVPFSMAYREIENGKLVSLSQSLGKVPLDVAVYGDTKSQLSISLLDLWSNNAQNRN